MNVSSSTSSSFAALQRPDSATLFKKSDANSDGVITQDELTTALANRSKGAEGSGPDATELFAQLDADGDGAITEAEHETGLAKMESERGLRSAPPPESDKAKELMDALKTLLEELTAANSESATSATAEENATSATASAATDDTDLTELIAQLLAEMKKTGDQPNLFESEA